MAYSPISNDEIDTDSALTTTLMRKYRDNLLGVLAGDGNAPRLDSKALSLISAINPFVSTNAGGNTISSIDLGDSREQIVKVECSLTNYADLNNRAIAINGVGDVYSFSSNTEDPIEGSSSVKLQGSNNNSSWSDLRTIISYSAGASGGSTTGSITAKNVLVWNGIGDSSYRYYRIYAEGDSDHDIEGDFYMFALGDRS